MFFDILLKCVKVIVLFMAVVKMTNTQRKIKDGAETQDTKRYMVYLLKAKESPRNYDEWLCGGVIVSETMIVTSAACVTDVEFMYAIAGTTKYVNVDNIDKDPCTKAMMKKVTKSCVPEAYEFSYDAVEKWSQIDIAIAEVETPFDFNAPPPAGCTHAPDIIAMNFDAKYQKPNTDVFMLGWGHKGTWRETSNTADLNNEQLNYGSTLILDKEMCKSEYSKVNPELIDIIDKYMICTLDRGNLNDMGQLIMEHTADKSGCRRQDGTTDANCVSRRAANLTYSDQSISSNSSLGSLKEQTKPEFQIAIASNTTKRKPPIEGNEVKNIMSVKGEEEKLTSTATKENLRSQNLEHLIINSVALNKSDSFIKRRGIMVNSRKQGLCQNDHGGPLITWRGTEEILIGIASVFQVDDNSKCIGPYLFTSTHCNSLFLDCVVNGGKNVKRMGAEGYYDYYVGSAPEPVYYQDVHAEMYGLRRGGLDMNIMAPACKRPPADMGFRFQLRRINWDQTNSGSELATLDVAKKTSQSDEIKIRPQIPLAMLRQTEN